MNSKGSSLEKAYENEFSEFLIKRIGNAGGSLHLQNITGHLSQVSSEVRNSIVGSKSDLIRFLKKHDNLFTIENDVVSIVKSSSFGNSDYNSDSSTTSHSNLPSQIIKGKGVIVKILSGYGFIKSKEPIKTGIYFNSLCFGDKDIDLTSFLHIGAIVFFNASRESSNCSSKYRAFKVWRENFGDDESNVSIQKSRKDRESGLYDPLNLESEGVIQNVFPNLGFISVKGDDNNTVFFHKNRVVNYDNIIDLTKIFLKGDKVEFSAHRSSKTNAKARWEATKVWKVSGKIQDNVSKSGHCQLSESRLPISALSSTVPEVIKNCCGRIYPRSHGAVIKFDNNEIADGDSALYYVCGTQVTEIGWEFTEGDDVYFDAVKIKSAPGWKAVLVWTEKKPDIVLPIDIGDYSEFIEEDYNDESCNSICTSKSNLCMTESSSSSLKSEKLSSKTKNLRNKNKKLSDCFMTNEVQDFNKSLSKNPKTSSRESLNSVSLSEKYCFIGKETKGINKKLSNYNASSRKSLNFLSCPDKKFHLKASKNKIVSVWADNSHTDDEAYESMEVSKHCTSEISLKCDNETNNFSVDELENSSEYASADEEKIHKHSEIKIDKTLSQNNSLESPPSIKKYHDIRGVVNKVFSRFAQIKSTIFQDIVSFSLNDFYLKGKSSDELGLDGLKSVLKIGDVIKFNCFVIIDDSHNNWQKITLAWKDIKPRHTIEISPEDFIKQNNLSVTINNAYNTNEKKDEIVQKKFLTSFVDDIPDDKIDNLSRTESCSEESIILSKKSQANSKSEQEIDSKNLSDAVYRILLNEFFPKDSMVDVKSVSEEIINTIQKYTMKTSTLLYDAVPEANCTTQPLENVCSKCKKRRSSLGSSSEITKNTAAQTIITGDIISQNILADW